MMQGLTNLNVELSSLCNKNCWMCGRRKREREDPEVLSSYGFMDFPLVQKIAGMTPPGIVVQFHWNGEPLLYPEFGKAIKAFPWTINNIVTNGKLLLEKFDEIVDNLDTIAVSVIERDTEAEKQYKIVKEFVERKYTRKPYTIIRCNGRVNNIYRYEELGLPIAYRQLHDPMGSFGYNVKQPTIPEVGVCWDFMHHLAIDRHGDVSICARFDPNGEGIIGNVKTESLDSLWNGDLRQGWLKEHLTGRRDNVPLCSKCEFWGVPSY